VNTNATVKRRVLLYDASQTCIASPTVTFSASVKSWTQANLPPGNYWAFVGGGNGFVYPASMPVSTVTNGYWGNATMTWPAKMYTMTNGDVQSDIIPLGSN
jgi:hypothetical protein